MDAMIARHSGGDALTSVPFSDFKSPLLLLNGAPLGHPVLEAALVDLCFGVSHLVEGDGGLSGTPAHHSVSD